MTYNIVCVVLIHLINVCIDQWLQAISITLNTELPMSL